jgi:hypothetical protein
LVNEEELVKKEENGLAFIKNFPQKLKAYKQKLQEQQVKIQQNNFSPKS